MAGDPGAWNSWQDVPSGEQNVINSLIDQWRQLSGFYGDIPDWAKLAAAKGDITSLWDMGQYLGNHVGNDGAHFIPVQAVINAPWSGFGMTADQFHSMYQSYMDVHRQLTGDQGMYQDFINRMAWSHGQLTPEAVREGIMDFARKNNAYGWLNYGLNYDQFQQKKLEMGQYFGASEAQAMTDQQAVQQLQYLHQGASASQWVDVRPTFTQQEKKQAQQGTIGQTAVR